MPKLFDDDTEDINININQEYAKNYDNWRQKEELNKLKTKYGDVNPKEESSSESSSEDEELEINEDDEKNFLKTYALLKSQNPKIYQGDVKFFEDKTENDTKKKKKVKSEHMTIRDYERINLMKTNGVLSDEDEEKSPLKAKRHKPTYVEEQQMIKEKFKQALEDTNNEDDDDIIIKKEKSQDQVEKGETSYAEWLKGQEAKINSEEQSELKPLRDYWSDPKLKKEEKFLRDYILNKKYLEKDTGEYEDDHYNINIGDENLSEDDDNLEKQEEFEHKFNFRFEEPDQDFIKRYPRTVEDSMRKKNNKRSEKRAQVKQRKEEEKIRKKEELKQLEALKRKELQEKIDKLKEISGNDDIRLEDLNLEGDFDPEEHEKRMKELYNDNFYAQPGEDMKPEFPDIDEELEIEKTWDDYIPTKEENYNDNFTGTHCEDEDFNMDADFDPLKSVQNELIESTKKKKRRRKSKFAEMLQKDKPLYNPSKYSNFEEYFNQYYNIGYEDMIGDLPCRMKYKKVVPNSYGLSVEEILMADDRELNKWCSLKKALQIKPEHVELNEVKTFKQKRQNEQLLKKILPSLFKDPAEDNNENKQNEEINKPSTSQSNKNKKKFKENVPQTETTLDEENQKQESNIKESPKKKPKQQENVEEVNKFNNKKRKISKEEKSNEEPKPKKKKHKKNKNDDKSTSETQNGSNSNKQSKGVGKDSKNYSNTGNKNKKHTSKKGNQKWENSNETNSLMSIGAETLRGYDINPKKFKNKFKYGKKRDV